MQTKVTRLVSNGSSFGFVWTWSKALDYESNEETQLAQFPIPNLLAKELRTGQF